MSPALQQFVSVALPIMVTLVATIWIASWSQNKRFDALTVAFNKRIDDLRSEMIGRFAGVNRRFDDILIRLDRIERKMDNHEERIVRLEERTSRSANRTTHCFTGTLETRHLSQFC
ncbi:MAG TPA: hypothetical protein VHZ74_06980 [Bryobacteraceae bacterium]|nr:hypothetical protein [Bryobacteraceae bacterium]